MKKFFLFFSILILMEQAQAESIYLLCSGEEKANSTLNGIEKNPTTRKISKNFLIEKRTSMYLLIDENKIVHHTDWDLKENNSWFWSNQSFKRGEFFVQVNYELYFFKMYRLFDDKNETFQKIISINRTNGEWREEKSSLRITGERSYGLNFEIKGSCKKKAEQLF